MISSKEVLLLMCALHVSSAANVAQYRDLHSFLDNMTTYDLRVPPLQRTTTGKDIVEIMIVFEVLKIVSLTTTTGTLEISGSLTLSWLDYRLNWSVPDYEIQRVRKPVNQVWTPEIVLRNGVKAPIMLLPQSGSSVLLHNNGRVSMERYDLFTVSCPVQVWKFPKDHQTCPIEFMTSKLDTGQLILQTVPDYDLRRREENGNEWIVMNVKQNITKNNATFGPARVETSIYTVNIDVRRQDIFYVLVIIVPCYFLTLLSYAPYLMPPQTAAHKCVIPISILLSYNIYMLLLERLMPKTSDLPVLGMSFAFLMGLCVFTEFMEVTLAKMYFCIGTCRMPACLSTLYFRIFANLVCYKRKEKTVVQVMPRDHFDNKAGQGEEDDLESWRDACVIHDRFGLLFAVSVSVFFLIYLPFRTSF